MLALVRLLLALVVIAAGCRSAAPKPGPGGALVIATADGCPSLIAAEGDHVYFATKSGTLVRVPKAGGKSEMLADKLEMPTGLIVGDAVYVAVRGAIVTIPKAGGSPVTVASGLGLALGLAMDPEALFFVDYAKDTSTIARVAKTGGNVDRLQSVPGLVSKLALDDKNLYFVAQHELVRLPKLGGFRAAVGLTVQGDALYADARNVFVLDGSSFVKVDKATGKTQRLAEIKGAPEPFIDARDIVWNDDRSKILAVSIEGGRPREIALEQPNPRAVAGDAENVYWVSCAADGEAGTVSKKARN